MNVIDILKQYADSPTDTNADFDAVARQVPPEVLGHGIAEALKSEETPSFGSMIGSLFGGSDPQQRAGLLTQLLGAAGPAILSSLGGGALGRIVQGMQGARQAAQPTTISPSDAAAVTPDQLQEIAAGAEKADPSIFDKIGAYYAQHPEVVVARSGVAGANGGTHGRARPRLVLNEIAKHAEHVGTITSRVYRTRPGLRLSKCARRAGPVPWTRLHLIRNRTAS